MSAPSTTEAIASLRRFRTRYEELRAARQASFVGALGAFRRAAAPMLPRDAEARYDWLAERLGDGTRAAPAVSPAELMDVWPSETQYSLLLASLLDPHRTGEVAEALWRELLRQLCEDGAAPRLEPAHMDRLEVYPKRHGSELHCFDVWARVPDDEGGHTFALLIENKVGAPEQPGQLAAYYRRVGEVYGPASRRRTVFLFLTPTGYEPTTAGQSRHAWRLMSWRTMAELLDRAAARFDEADEEATLLRQTAALVRRRILGIPRRRDPTRIFRRVRRALAASQDRQAALAAHHRALLTAQRAVLALGGDR